MHNLTAMVIRGVGHLWGVLALLAVLLIGGLLCTPPGWLVVPFVVWIGHRWNRNRAADVLSAVEQAIVLQVPVVSVLEASKERWSSRSNKTLGNVAQWLRGGVPLGRALVNEVPSLPDRWEGLIVAGERRGQLLHTIQRILREHRNFVFEDSGRGPLAIYLTILAGLVWGVGALLGRTSARFFPELFADEGVDMPPFLDWFYGLWDYGPHTLGLFLLLPILATVAITFIYIVFGGSSGLSRHLGTLGWWLPGINVIVRSRAYADLCGALADTVDAGMTIPEALRINRDLPLPIQLLSGMENCAVGIEKGQSPDDAARDARWHASIVSMLRFTGGGASLASGFDLVAHQFEWQYRRRLALVQRLIIAGLFLFVAVTVGIFAYAFAVALVALQYAALDGTGVY